MRAFAQKPKAALQTTSTKSAIPGRAHFGQSPEVRSILHLQRTIGNQAVQWMMQTHAEDLNAALTGRASLQFGHDFSEIPIHPPAAEAIQTKLAINKPEDLYEQEADRISEQVMRMREPQLQRACACGGSCPECRTEQTAREHERLQTKRVGPGGLGRTIAPPGVHHVLRSPGRPLATTARAFMEPRFGHDFGQVRVHTDAKAAESAQSVNALAYTVGRDVVFGAGRYAPETIEGQRLLAHELTHVLQQEREGTSLQRRDDDDKDAPKDTRKDAPKDAPKDASGGSCGGKSLASGIGPSDKRLNGTPLDVELDADDFGNTSKLGADFQFSACKVGTTWRFKLDALVVPIGSRVQAATFRKNIVSASDSEVTKDSYPDIVRDLSPTKSGTFSVKCGGKKFKDKATTFSSRKTFWNHQFVIDHEAFHRKDWLDIYRPELIKAEGDVWTHSIPQSKAKDAAGAVAEANKDLIKYMTDAFQRTCDAYAPKQESRAYDAGAPAYQKLVDEINARAKKDKWT